MLPKLRSFWGSILGPYYLGDPERDQKFDNLTSHGHTVLPKAAIMAAAVWAFAWGLRSLGIKALKLAYSG